MRWITSRVANPTKTPTGAFSETGAFLIGWLLCTGHERDDLGHRALLRIDHAGTLPEPVDVNPVGQLEHVRHVVADEHHGNTAVADRFDQVDDLSRLPNAESSGRLVHDDHAAAERGGPRHRDALTLPTGQRLHRLVHGLDADLQIREVLRRLLAHSRHVQSPEEAARNAFTSYLASEVQIRREVQSRYHGEILVHRLDSGCSGVSGVLE